MGAALEIGGALSADGVRRAARREKDGRAAARMDAIAHALDGLIRAEAARLAGMERRALRDAVLRCKAEGLAGLRDRPKGRPPRRLMPEEEAEARRGVPHAAPIPPRTAVAPGRAPISAAGSSGASAGPITLRA